MLVYYRVVMLQHRKANESGNKHNEKINYIKAKKEPIQMDQ